MKDLYYSLLLGEYGAARCNQVERIIESKEAGGRFKRIYQEAKDAGVEAQDITDLLVYAGVAEGLLQALLEEV